jgi:hypothetical protein
MSTAESCAYDLQIWRWGPTCSRWAERCLCAKFCLSRLTYAQKSVPPDFMRVFVRRVAASAGFSSQSIDSIEYDSEVTGHAGVSSCAGAAMENKRTGLLHKVVHTTNSCDAAPENQRVIGAYCNWS